jgi:hypothetical protein
MPLEETLDLGRQVAEGLEAHGNTIRVRMSKK